MPAPHLDEGLVGSLNDSLAADVYPRSRRHLPKHHQAATIQLIEVIPARPLRHEIRIRQQHAGRIAVSSEDSDGFPGLNQQGLITLERAQRFNDSLETLPV